MENEKLNLNSKNLKLKEEENPFSFKNFLNPNKNELASQFQPENDLEYNISLHQQNENIGIDKKGQFEGFKYCFKFKYLNPLMTNIFG